MSEADYTEGYRDGVKGAAYVIRRFAPELTESESLVETLAELIEEECGA